MANQSDQHDEVWDHGEKRGNGFWCKHCKLEKAGGGATRLKEHLAHRGKNVARCKSVPPDVKEYWQRALDRIKEKSRHRALGRLQQEEIAGWKDAYYTGGMTEEEQLQAAMHQSRAEADYIRQTGGRYERGGGSGTTEADQEGPLKRFLRRATSVRERTRAQDYNISAGTGKVQPRIDTHKWVAGNAPKTALGMAWAKFFHTSGIPGRRADNPYFKSAIKETQKWGEGTPPPSGYEIDGRYLDENEKEIETEMKRWKKEWPEFGLTIMCDSWTGLTGMSIINFLLFCNGVMYFKKSVTATNHTQDAQFLFKEIKVVVDDVGPHMRSERSRSRRSRASHAPKDSSCSEQSVSNSGGYSYRNLPEATLISNTNYIYQWQQPEYYEMLYQDWQTRSLWSGQSWEDYKAQLHATQGIMLISTWDYNVMQSQYQQAQMHSYKSTYQWE